MIFKNKKFVVQRLWGTWSFKLLFGGIPGIAHRENNKPAYIHEDGSVFYFLNGRCFKDNVIWKK